MHHTISASPLSANSHLSSKSNWLSAFARIDYIFDNWRQL